MTADLLGNALCYRLRNTSLQYVPLVVSPVKQPSQMSPRSVKQPSQIPLVIPPLFTSNKTVLNHSHNHSHSRNYNHTHNHSHVHHHSYSHNDNHSLNPYLSASQLIWRRAQATRCTPPSQSNTHSPHPNTHPPPINSIPPRINYNPEMHRFEEMDLNRQGLVDPLALALVHDEREKRLQHCSHTYLFI